MNKQSTSPSSPAELSKGQKNLALVVILCMTLMEMLDTTIANVALPTLQTAFEVDMALVQWVSSTLLVVSCAFLLTFGRLGDMIGKVRVFQFGVVTFTVGSLLSALAPSLPVLIAARAVQGLGIAASMANNQGIITEMFADSRGRALGLLATFTALGAMSGPTIGGTLVSIAPWRVIFLINVPIGIVSFLVGLRVLPNRRPAERKRFDVKGAVLLSPAILLFFAAITLTALGMPISSVTLSVWAGDLSGGDTYQRTVKWYTSAYMLGSLVTGPLPGLSADRLDSYVPAYLLFALMLLIAAVLVQGVYRRLDLGKRPQ